MIAFDTADVLLGKGAALAAAGVKYVGLYTRPDRTPWDEVQELQDHGIKMWSIYEKGNATNKDYFTVKQAIYDAHSFLAWAKAVGQPTGTDVAFCADYDSNWDDVFPYFVQVHSIVKPEGYFSCGYGNGDLNMNLIKNGYARRQYLSQSKGFKDYDECLATTPSIVQELEPSSFLGFNIDPDVVNDLGALW